MLKSSSDKHAFAELYARYFILLRRHAIKFRVEEGAASDIAQNILVDLWMKHKEMNIQHKISSYLYRAVHNQVSKHNRTEVMISSYAEDFRQRYDEAFCSTDDALSVKETNEILGRALDRMSPNMRLAFESSRFQDMTSREISEKFQIPVYTVRDYLKRAMQLIRKMGVRLNLFL